MFVGIGGYFGIDCTTNLGRRAVFTLLEVNMTLNSTILKLHSLKLTHG